MRDKFFKIFWGLSGKPQSKKKKKQKQKTSVRIWFGEVCQKCQKVWAAD